MRKVIIALLLIVSALSQFVNLPNGTTTTSGDGGPRANLQFDRGEQVPSTIQSTTSGPNAPTAVTGQSRWAAANSVWDSLTVLGGGCCNNCNIICGFAIYRHGTGDALTNMNGYFSFNTLTTGPNENQIYTLSQNSDCTWSISNKGQYVSLFNTKYKEPWAGTNGRVTKGERWHLTRNVQNTATYVESANFIKHYWRTTASPPYYLSTANGVASKFTFVFYACDKLFGWSS